MLNFFDFEVYAYDWLVVIINPIKKTEEVIINDPERLKEYFESVRDEIWVGFNSLHYDQYIMKAILLGIDPKKVNDFIIKDHNEGYAYSSAFKEIEMINYDVMKLGEGGLKVLEGFMGNDIRETEVDFNIDRKLTVKEIKSVAKYCRHDVEQLIEVFLYRKPFFDTRLTLVNVYKLPLSNISKSLAQLAAIILQAVRRTTNDKWNIRVPKNLKLKKYKKVADWFLDSANHNDDSKFQTEISGVDHTFAWGGVHSAKSKYNYVCKDDEMFIMADVNQLYPYIMLKYRLLSRACPDSAYDTLQNTIDISIRLKKEGKKAERQPYKDFNNIVYGAMGDPTNAMYDPLHRALVCVYGQLFLLDLAEQIEPFAELIQSNTDGILVKIKKKDFDKLDDAVYEWEKRTCLSMTFDYYKQVFQGDVNNYLSVDYEGNIKAKGGYVKKLSPLDYNLPIVNQAIVNYITKGITPEETVYKCKSLKEFQIVVNVSNKYEFGVHNGLRLSGKVFRVFASNTNRDSFIGKYKGSTNTVEKFANTPEHCFIFNDNVNDAEIPENLDKTWYVKLAEKRLKDKFHIEV